MFIETGIERSGAALGAGCRYAAPTAARNMDWPNSINITLLRSLHFRSPVFTFQTPYTETAFCVLMKFLNDQLLVSA
jgi:hypothetical protein